MSPSRPIVDFHGHWFPPAVVGARASASLPGVVQAAWPLLTDVEAQLDAAAAAGTDVRVVNAVLSSIAPASTVPVRELPARVNDALAEAVRDHGPRLAALATVDAYLGDEGAEEARRAVEDLGLPGIVVDAAQGERLLSAPEARPTLAYAAAAGVPVFAHPVNPPVLPPRYAARGHAGVLLARASESALSTLALLDGGALDELAGLEIVLAGIGGIALVLGGFLAEPAARARQRLYVDTMGFDAAVVRFYLDVVGPEHVLVGSDWPIIDRDASRERVTGLLDAIGADDAGRDRIAGGNALRLLGLAPVPTGR